MDQPVARSRKSQVLKVVLWTGNHILRWQLRHGLGPRAFALLETTDPAVVAALCRRRVCVMSSPVWRTLNLPGIRRSRR